MSGYNPVHTYQVPDYEEGNRLREKWHRKVARLKKQGMDLFAALRKAGHMPTAPLVTRVVPNPLSVELRIVLVYFWESYKGCVSVARWSREKLWSEGGSEVAAAGYEAEALEVLKDVHNLCFFLFSPASRYSHIHIHSEYGCNDDNCPAWQLGFEAAKESVGDWHQPEPLYSV